MFFHLVHFCRGIFSGSGKNDLSLRVKNKKIRDVLLFKIQTFLVWLKFSFVKKDVWKELRIDVLQCLALRGTSSGCVDTRKHRDEIDIHIIGKSRENSSSLLYEFFEYRLKPAVQFVFRFF